MFSNLYNQTRNIFKNILNKNNKYVFIFNYHQIHKKSSIKNIKRLHSVNIRIFKFQIKIMSVIGSFVSLNHIIENNLNSKINFLITFDDVPESFFYVLNFLKSKDIPVLLCPSVKITQDGYGWRNKVYDILDYYSPKSIENKLKILGQINKSENDFSFYKFTKSDRNNSIDMEKKVIDPLFKEIPKIKTSSLIKKHYLDWKDYKKILSSYKSIEIVNHSFDHYNMSTLSKNDISKDFIDSNEQIEENLNILPRCFAVPFGAVTNNLLIDLTNIALSKNYRTIMWVTNSANIVSNKKNHQIYQLGRIHTPESIFGFMKILILSFLRAEHNIIPFSKANYSSNSTPELKSSSEMRPALSIENILRPNKDFASDPEYFNYLYNNNIFKGNRPHYYYLNEDGRMSCIGYNFHSKFYLSGKLYDGIYWAGMRSLPFKKNVQNASLLFKAMQNEPIIGSYKPNKEFQKILNNKYWKKIELKKIEIFPKEIKNFNDSKYKIKLNLCSSKDLDCILDRSRSKYFFSIYRSSEYYKWRYDNYCYAKAKYFILEKNGDPSSFLIFQTKDKTASISDFSFNSIDEFNYLIEYVIKYAYENEYTTVDIETNIEEIFNLLINNYKTKKTTFYIYYYFNKKIFNKQYDEIEKNFKDNNLIETQTSGDILLR